MASLTQSHFIGLRTKEFYLCCYQLKNALGDWEYLLGIKQSIACNFTSFQGLMAMSFYLGDLYMYSQVLRCPGAQVHNSFLTLCFLISKLMIMKKVLKFPNSPSLKPSSEFLFITVTK